MILGTLKEEVPNVSLGMFTSGILEKNDELCPVSEEYAKLLVEDGLKICYFSIYDAEEKEHDWMTGQPGSFRITEAAIRNLLKCGVDIRFNLVVTQRNKERVSDIVDLAGSWGGSEVRLLKLVNHGRAEKSWGDIGIEEGEYRQIVGKTYKESGTVRITASSCVDILPCQMLKSVRRVRGFCM